MSRPPSRAPPAREPGVPSKAPIPEPRAAAASPSQVPLPASAMPLLPSVIPSAAAAPLPSKGGPLPSRVPPPPSARPSTIPPPGSRAPGASTYAPSRVPLATTAPRLSFAASAVPGPVRAAAPLPTTTAMTTTTTFPGLRSVYRDPEDLRRAGMQSAYGALAPAERAAQDSWAKRKADEFAPCPFNFAWERDAGYPGYRCTGGAHYMSDMILAEGVPGLYALPNCHDGLKNADRIPAPQENVPRGMCGPIRPIGVDRNGRYTYFEHAIDWPLTLKRSQAEPIFNHLNKPAR